MGAMRLGKARGKVRILIREISVLGPPGGFGRMDLKR